jgi:hypothetical protein
LRRTTTAISTTAAAAKNAKSPAITGWVDDDHEGGSAEAAGQQTEAGQD